VNDDLPQAERERRDRQWAIGFDLMDRNQEMADLRRIPPHRRGVPATVGGRAVTWGALRALMEAIRLWHRDLRRAARRRAR
jgi:hypothetical protein